MKQPGAWVRYNARSEVISALMATNNYGYDYDPIGNREWTQMNANER